MGYTLTVTKCYGYKLDEELYDVYGGDLLDRVTELGDSVDYGVRLDARKALGVEFNTYACGDDPPMVLSITASAETARGAGIVPIGTLDVDPTWVAKLDYVIGKLGLKVDGPPQWCALAYYG